MTLIIHNSIIQMYQERCALIQLIYEVMLMAENEIKLSDSRHYRTNPDFILRKISGEAVLVPTGDTVFGNSMISVNETFTYLWELFSEPVTIPEALAKAKEDYEDPSGEMEAQILQFIAESIQYGMIIEEED